MSLPSTLLRDQITCTCLYNGEMLQAIQRDYRRPKKFRQRERLRHFDSGLALDAGDQARRLWLLIVVPLVMGCAGNAAAPPATPVTHIPERGGWFCEPNPEGAGWVCVQELERDGARSR